MLVWVLPIFIMKKRLFIVLVLVLVSVMCVGCIASKRGGHGDEEISSSDVSATVSEVTAQAKVELVTETPKFGLSDELLVKVMVTDFAEEVDAFDITLNFNTSKLELIGVYEGDLVDTQGTEADIAATEVGIANESGRLAMMYVDMTAGDHTVKISSDVPVIYFTMKAKKPFTGEVIEVMDANFISVEGEEIGNPMLGRLEVSCG